MFNKKRTEALKGLLRRLTNEQDEKDAKVSPNNMFTKKGQSSCRAYQGEDEKDTKVSNNIMFSS
jgi:hypothetical protein